MSYLPYDIPDGADVALVLPHPEYHSVNQKSSWAGRGVGVLDNALKEAALSRNRCAVLYVSRYVPKGKWLPKDVWTKEVRALKAALRRLRPKLILTFGDEGLHLLSLEAKGLSSFDVRGYFFVADDFPTTPLLACTDLVQTHDIWTPWRVLLTHDLSKAKDVLDDGHLRTPSRSVTIVHTSRDARRAVEAVRDTGIAGVDIETRGSGALACIGFAPESEQAFVFPASNVSGARELLRSPSLTAIWANGIYDLFVLKHREGWDVRAQNEDVQIAFHAAYPELAGKEEDLGGHKVTRKSLAFLASMCTRDPWWKCVEASTPVLMGDLSWKPIKEVEVGEEVIGFTEQAESQYKRHYKVAEVLDKHQEQAPCYKITTDCGEVIATGTHRFLVKDKGNRIRYRSVNELRPGWCLKFVGSWEPDTSYESGWLAGFLDGEGTLGASTPNSKTATGCFLAGYQVEGPVLDRVLTYCDRLGFSVNTYRREARAKNHQDGYTIQWLGGTPEVLRTLGMLRPVKLLRDFRKKVLDTGKMSMRTTSAVIKKVEFVGLCEVVDLSTSSKTYIAGGFASHNSRYETEEEFFVYNGKDACITLDVWDYVQAEVESMGARSTYEHERDLMWPCVDMLARGLRVNNALRRERVEALNAKYQDVFDSLQTLVTPFLKDNEKSLRQRGLWDTFELQEGVCECCRHASKKQSRCWSCAGFAKAPKKTELLSLANAVRLKGREEMKKDELEAALLGPCLRCGGESRRRWLEFNPKSQPQKVALLYDVLKAPQRRKDGKLTTNEDALKSILGAL